MATYSELREHVLDLLWSQWRELGVAGSVSRRHVDDCIDPEPLIAFTATHGDLDPRLRDESIDWVLQYGTYVSKARLKNVLSHQGLRDDPLFLEYAATINANGGAGWPAPGARPMTFHPRRRALLEDLGRPALVSLRIRAIFGVGARAELIRVLLADPKVAMTAADLAAETSYGKRNVLTELEPLRSAGIVRSVRAMNADRYSLAKTDQLLALVGPLPVRFTPWTQTFALLHVLIALARQSDARSGLQNAVDATGIVERDTALFTSAKVRPPTLPAGPSAWPAFLEWSVSFARSLART